MTPLGRKVTVNVKMFDTAHRYIIVSFHMWHDLILTIKLASKMACLCVSYIHVINECKCRRFNRDFIMKQFSVIYRAKSKN